MIGDILQPTHLLFILVIALIVLGPKRLPEVGRSLGRGLRDFRSAISGQDQELPEGQQLQSGEGNAQPQEPASATPPPPQEPASATPPAPQEPATATAAPPQEPAQPEPTAVSAAQSPASQEPASVSAEQDSTGSA